MPILNGTVTFSRYDVELTDPPSPGDIQRWLGVGLRAKRFVAIDKRSDEERASGFVEFEDHDATEFGPGSLSFGEYALMTWRIDTLKVPAAELKAELGRWAEAFEGEHKRQPSRGEKAERRSALRLAMRTRTAPATKTCDVSWNFRTQQLLVWTASRTTIDQILEAIESSLRVTLHAQVPSAVARRQGLADELLGPTAELFGLNLSGTDAVGLAFSFNSADGERAEN